MTGTAIQDMGASLSNGGESARLHLIIGMRRWQPRFRKWRVCGVSPLRCSFRRKIAALDWRYESARRIRLLRAKERSRRFLLPRHQVRFSFALVIIIRTA